MAEKTKKSVVLGVTGGIAAYKAAELTRELARNGIEVQVVMTEAAGGLVTPATFQALSGKPVYTDLWDARVADNMAHIELSRGRDAIVVAPATAVMAPALAANRPDSEPKRASASRATSTALFPRTPVRRKIASSSASVSDSAPRLRSFSRGRSSSGQSVMRMKA